MTTWSPITERQVDVAVMIVAGYAARQIADALHITTRVVTKRLQLMRMRFGATTNEEAARRLLLAYKRGAA